MHSELAEARGGVDTAAARDTADTLRTAGYDELAAQVGALADALDAWRDLAIAETTRAAAAEAECARLRGAMPEPQYLDDAATALAEYAPDDWPITIKMLHHWAAAIRAALAHGGGAGAGTGGAG